MLGDYGKLFQNESTLTGSGTALAILRVSLTEVYLLLYKTNRLHFAVGLFSYRSQKTSKCGKNIIGTLG